MECGRVKNGCEKWTVYVIMESLESAMRVLLLVFAASLAMADDIEIDTTLVAQTKKVRPAPVTVSSSQALGGREVASTKDLYSAIPGEAKESKVVGGLVKSYSGSVDIICAKDTLVCIVTFKDKK
jgi:hypothetical protein